jgi:biotin-(acetyl-CoA carboxylase) ligase
VIDEWQSRNVTLGQKVRVITVRDRVEGTAEALDANGGLILRLADGTSNGDLRGLLSPIIDIHTEMGRDPLESSDP